MHGIREVVLAIGDRMLGVVLILALIARTRHPDDSLEALRANLVNHRLEVIMQCFIRNFKSQVPMVETKPIMVTEIDWSPEDPDKASEGQVLHEHQSRNPYAIDTDYHPIALPD